MSEPWDRALRLLLHECARSLGLALADGVYLGLTGPAYETPAEVRMLERLGVDAVGMSTVGEAIVARAAGLRVVGISCITNFGAGMSLAPVDHAEALRVTEQAAERFESLVTEFIRRLPPNSMGSESGL
jgi:purine-nucleoside phosphorylase